MIAYALQLPDLGTLGQEMIEFIDIDRLHAARKIVKKRIGELLANELTILYHKLSSQLSQNEYKFNPLVNYIYILFSSIILDYIYVNLGFVLS